MTDETHPSFAHLIEVGTRRFQAAQTPAERRDIQRDHIAAVATTLAEITLLDAAAEPGLSAECAKGMLRNALVLLTVNTAIMLEAHGLGEPLMPEDERADLAHDTYRERVRVLMLAGEPGGRA